MTESSQTTQTDAEVAPETPRVPAVYFNGFEVNNSLADMSLLLVLDGAPIVRLNLSFTTAKTLGIYLSNAVKAFEERTSHTIMSMDEVAQGLAKK